MRDNIDKVAQRGENLDRLGETTGKLSEQAKQFHRGANQVRKKMWWKVSGCTGLTCSRGTDCISRI